VPDLSRHVELVRKVDGQGFAAVWMRDVPVFDSVRMGDAGSVYDVFAHLGFLAGITKNVALGTAAAVLPIRHPMMIAKPAATVDALSGGRLILALPRAIGRSNIRCSASTSKRAASASGSGLLYADGLDGGRLPSAKGARSHLDLLPARAAHDPAGRGRAGPAER
jgi:hypothetical protein